MVCCTSHEFGLEVNLQKRRHQKYYPTLHQAFNTLSSVGCSHKIFENYRRRKRFKATVTLSSFFPSTLDRICLQFVKCGVESKNDTSFLKVWLCYERLHLIAFLADILSLLKKFQKYCQSDSICITDILPLRASFVSSLENCKTNVLADGWEQLFLQNVNNSGSSMVSRN